MNHAKTSRSAGSMHIVRVALFFTIVLGMLWGIYRLTTPQEADITWEEEPVQERFYLPKGSEESCSLVHHRYFSLCYDEDKEVARWVAYSLTAQSLKAKNVKRTDDYRADEKITTKSADPRDYRGSGYDRGHLVAAADRAFKHEAMSETFLMSNIAPQEHYFNGGIWRELEQNTRRWARKKGKLYVVTGPIYQSQTPKRIGKNKVAVPDAFFRVLLNPDEYNLQGIAFLIPNAMSDEPLEKYQLPIDSVEVLTGLDFFAELLLDSLEEAVEAEFDPSNWPIDQRTYRQRVHKWNRSNR